MDGVGGGGVENDVGCHGEKITDEGNERTRSRKANDDTYGPLTFVVGATVGKDVGKRDGWDVGC